MHAMIATPFMIPLAYDLFRNLRGSVSPRLSTACEQAFEEFARVAEADARGARWKTLPVSYHATWRDTVRCPAAPRPYNTGGAQVTVLNMRISEGPVLYT